MSGELNRLQMTSGGPAYNEEGWPDSPFEAFVDLLFPPVGEEAQNIAEWQFWTPPPVKTAAQVVLRTDWVAYFGDPTGWATFLLTIETFNETDPAGTLNSASMAFDVGLNPPFSPDNVICTIVDIDITGFYTVPDDVTHTNIRLERQAYAGQEPEGPLLGEVRFQNGRTLTDVEVAAAVNILPWV